MELSLSGTRNERWVDGGVEVEGDALPNVFRAMGVMNDDWFEREEVKLL